MYFHRHSAGLTNGATRHGGQDLQGGRGPTFTYDGVYVSFTIIPFHVPSPRPVSSKLMSRAGQVGDIVCEIERQQNKGR